MDKKGIIIGVLIVILFFMYFSIRGKKAEYDLFKKQIAKFELNEQMFLNERDKQGRLISEQEQVILTQKDAIDLGLLEIDRLKKVNSQVVVKTITQIDSVFIPFKDTLNTFSISTDWYGLSGKVLTGGVRIDTLGVLNKMSVTIGLKSNGWFSAPNPSVVITNENPYTYTTSMSNIVVKNEKKWYQKNSFIFGSGLFSGLIVTKLLR